MTKTVHFVIADDSNVDLDKDTLGLMFVCALCSVPPLRLNLNGRGKFKFRDLAHENNRRGEIINVCLNILATMSSTEREKDAKRG